MILVLSLSLFGCLLLNSERSCYESAAVVGSSAGLKLMIRSISAFFFLSSSLRHRSLVTFFERSLLLFRHAILDAAVELEVVPQEQLVALRQVRVVPLLDVFHKHDRRYGVEETTPKHDDHWCEHAVVLRLVCTAHDTVEPTVVVETDGQREISTHCATKQDNKKERDPQLHAFNRLRRKFVT